MTERAETEAKIRDLVASGELGRILYFDSVRINLGLFQPDFNVIWDLAPHDLTIMDFVLSQTLGTQARWVSAIGASHYGRHENLAYVTVGFDNELLASVHVNWVAPVKTRRTIVAGDNYWNLAKEIYGDGFMWKKISEANPGLNPNKLPIGGTLTIPPKG